MLSQNLELIRGRIVVACQKVGRNPETITLVAVSKTHPPEIVNELAHLGVREFGENKVQEAKSKIPLCDSHLRWHGIGHLQTNKIRDAVHLFAMIHSVDSLRLAHEIEKEAAVQSRRLSILLEVNVSGEGSKFGFKPGEVLDATAIINRLPHLELRGLMTMAPYSEESEKSRPFFRQLAKLKNEIESNLEILLPDLSMGMSGDFEVGIEEGATLVRIGTALFGKRKSAAFRAASTHLD